MEFRKLSPFGVEISGWRLDQASADEAHLLIETISRHRIAVFADQVCDDVGLVRFLNTLGELTFTQGETPVDGSPDLNLVSNIGRSTPPRSVFHTDTSYVDRPPSFTALRPVVLPQASGATVFSDQVEAARRLPPIASQYLRGRTVRHRTTGLDGRDESVQVLAGTSLARRTRRARVRLLHPILRRHPVTGETALYMSTPERCSGLSGVDGPTSERIVSVLYRHSIKPSRLYRHLWRPGDVIVWDNRVSMHRADHLGVHGDRVLHRGMVLGEVPIAA